MFYYIYTITTLYIIIYNNFNTIETLENNKTEENKNVIVLVLKLIQI